jgi:hypothetical protein
LSFPQAQAYKTSFPRNWESWIVIPAKAGIHVIDL